MTLHHEVSLADALCASAAHHSTGNFPAYEDATGVADDVKQTLHLAIHQRDQALTELRDARADKEEVDELYSSLSSDHDILLQDCESLEQSEEDLEATVQALERKLNEVESAKKASQVKVKRMGAENRQLQGQLDRARAAVSEKDVTLAVVRSAVAEGPQYAGSADQMASSRSASSCRRCRSQR